MTALRLDTLMYELANDGKWRDDRLPKVFLDGREVDLAREHGVLSGDVASVIGANARNFAPLVARLDVAKLGLFDLRTGDLGGLAGLGRLTHLMLVGTTKVSDISVLRQLSGVRVLSLEDCPKINDLDPIASLVGLVAFSFSGGMWNAHRAATLAPVGELGSLEELRLLNLRVTEGGLRPLAGCRALKHLWLSNQFETADYAYLSVRLPHAECEMFAADTALATPIDGKDVMVTGKRKPFLNSVADADRLARYRSAFRRLQEDFRALRD
ncbi:hypothetical protein QKW60_04260 [Defluviimonas aestuarii]|uniref:hypothetical protein n=1 Tax=Albidovulum aestuarii TaxID=1130726 RepID=UPI00249B3BB1|nr:hypothetical protein [Defluviimonas aestuarii]MDI3335610.1 hypothetical protein [Defluviimonas aestuarii]